MRTVSANLSKSYGPVCKVYGFKNDLGKFVRIKSIQNGYSGFSKHVGSFIKLCRRYVPPKFSIADPVISRLGSPINRKSSYVSVCASYIFSENIQMIWNKIFMRVLGETQQNFLLTETPFPKTLHNLVKVL